MKKISFTHLTLSHFKGIANLDIEFHHDNTTISGDNGTGKTTIADAIFWVLFDKNSLGATKFEARTINPDGSYLSNVETSATLSLTIDAVPHTFKKQLVVKTDSYSSPQSRKQSATAKFFIDGQAYTKGDYGNFISSVISEDAFRTVTSPTFFLSLPWQQQRALLSQIVSAPDIAEVNKEHLYDAVEEVLRSGQFADAEAYAKHLHYQLSEVKKQLDDIPLQIEEQKATMPEAYDWSVLAAQKDMMMKTLQSLESRLLTLKTAPDDAHRASIREQIEFQRKRIDTMRTSAFNMYNQDILAENATITEKRGKLAEYEQSARDLDAKLQSLLTRISQTTSSIAEQRTEQERIRTEWASRVNRKYEPQYESSCPVCGQPLPYDKIQEAKEKDLALFNEQKALAKKELTDRANLSKGLITRAENDIKAYESEVNLVRGQIKAVTGYIKNLKEELSKTSKVATAEERYLNNPGYADAMARIKDLEEQLQQSDINADNTEDIALTSKLIEEKQNALADINMCLAVRPTYEAHQSRIEELKTKQEALRTQYDSLLSQSNQCHEFILHANSILENSINDHFSYVRFTLFRYLVNGSVEPFCEAQVDGIPVQTNVNNAARINAGLDICNAFAKAFDVCAPVVLDNCETINSILPTEGQQIRLYVSADPTLVIR